MHSGLQHGRTVDTSRMPEWGQPVLPDAYLVRYVHLSCITRQLLDIKLHDILMVRQLATVELKARPLLAIVTCL